MKKFRFTLSRMLDFKNQILDREKDALGVLRRKKNEIDLKIETYEQQLAHAAEEMLQDQKRGTTAARLRFYSMQLDNAKKCLKQLRKEQAAMQAEVDRQAAVVRKASQEVSSLEKLKERQWEQYQYEENQAAAAEVLEFVSGRLVRQPKK